MNPFRLFLTVTILAFFTFAITPASAGSMGNGAAQRMKLVIDSVDPVAGTIVFKSQVDQSIHAYKIDETTRIALGNAKATVNQLKPGMKVQNFMAPGEGQNLKILMVSVAPTATPAVAAPAAQ